MINFLDNIQNETSKFRTRNHEQCINPVIKSNLKLQ